MFNTPSGRPASLQTLESKYEVIGVISDGFPITQFPAARAGAIFQLKRYKHTLRFLNEVISKEEKILDLGVSNTFSEILTQEGFDVTNTKGKDFDLATNVV